MAHVHVKERLIGTPLIMTDTLNYAHSLQGYNIWRSTSLKDKDVIQTWVEYPGPSEERILGSHVDDHLLVSGLCWLTAFGYLLRRILSSIMNNLRLNPLSSAKWLLPSFLDSPLLLLDPDVDELSLSLDIPYKKESWRHKEGM